jgi:hypothetical protein
MVPPSMLHGVFGGAGAVPHVCIIVSQPTTTHGFDGGAQSLESTQPTQAPLPSQTAPPLSLHGVSCGASSTMHMKTVGLHKFAWQAVVVMGVQSAGDAQPGMHVPLPSQTLPPLSLHGVPRTATVVPHASLMQVALLHAVVGTGQLATLHMAPTAMSPPPVMFMSAVVFGGTPGQMVALSMHAP